MRGEEWILNLKYGLATYKLKSVVEYHSAQIMRIRVHGKTSSLLLENDYPINAHSPRPKGIKWKIREGALLIGDMQKNAQLLTDIMAQLEYYIKGKNNEPTNVEYIQKKKGY